MSLVICSNNAGDGESQRQASSIYSAFSFRNQLSSTYKIPAHSQVALQSVKVNVDGRVVVSRQNNVLYQYFGKKLTIDDPDEDFNAAKTRMVDTPYHPLRVQILDSGEIGEFNPSDFAVQLGKQLKGTIYHPNLQGLPSVERLQNASSLDFLGYKIKFDQSPSSVNVNKAITNVKQHYSAELDRNGSGVFTYTPATKTFQRDASLGKYNRCCGIFTDNPLSLNGGTMEVNISNASANANASGVQWMVGLSRYIALAEEGTDRYVPSYYNDVYADVINMMDTGFVDFGCGRNSADELVVFQSSYDPDLDTTTRKEVQYWLNASSGFSGGSRTNLSGVNYQKVKFTATGEQMKVEIYDGGKAVWVTITDYFAVPTNATKITQFGPIHQACWCLHPVLQVGWLSTATDSTLSIVDIATPPITDYDVTKLNKSGWWETMELLNATRWCFNVESRKILQLGDDTPEALYTQTGLNASGYNAALSHVLILTESNIYKPSIGANAQAVLGFNRAVVDTPNVGFGTWPVEFHSSQRPSLESSQAMFVRLDGMNQRVVNALTGNKSQIIGHLPRFDSGQDTGRLYFEPKNLIWIDLDNPGEMTVSDFNLSFCYSNEQYATTLIGQSIVCLYFRSPITTKEIRY